MGSNGKIERLDALQLLWDCGNREIWGRNDVNHVSNVL